MVGDDGTDHEYLPCSNVVTSTFAAQMNDSCRQFGIRISDRQIQTRARILDAPTIQYNPVRSSSPWSVSVLVLGPSCHHGNEPSPWSR